MSQRIKRINELIRRELSQIIFKEIEFEKGTFITVSRAETSGDLTITKVYLSVMPEEREEKVFKRLNRLLWFLQKELNEKLKIKRVPKIKLIKDEETRRAMEIENILKRLKSRGG